MAEAKRDVTSAAPERTIRRHLLWGWSLLLVFLAMGAVLEAMHGFKVGWYVDVANGTRRLMLTLSHAHGALAGLVHVGFASTLRGSSVRESDVSAASASLIAGSILLPGGFLLGGIVIYGGDPGLGVFLTPVGALLLVASAALTIRAIRRGSR